jgi:hypothetical protein
VELFILHSFLSAPQYPKEVEMGRVKADFIKYLNHWVTFNHKEGCLDDETAEWLLHEATFDEAQKYIDEQEFKGDMAAEAAMEQEAIDKYEAEMEATERAVEISREPLELTPEQEDILLEEGRERDHERAS